MDRVGATDVVLCLVLLLVLVEKRDRRIVREESTKVVGDLEELEILLDAIGVPEKTPILVLLVVLVED